MQHYFLSFNSQNSRETLANRAHFFASVIIVLSLAFCQDAFAQIIATYKETYRPHFEFRARNRLVHMTRAQSPMLNTLLASLTVNSSPPEPRRFFIVLGGLGKSYAA